MQRSDTKTAKYKPRLAVGISILIVECPIGPGKGVRSNARDVITSWTAAKLCCGVLDVYNERKNLMYY